MRHRGDETKLPKWAQWELGRLQRDLEYAHRKLRVGPEDSTVFARANSNSPTPLGDADITFQLPDGKICVRIENDYLDVNGASGILTVHPQASNSIRLRTGKWSAT